MDTPTLEVLNTLRKLNVIGGPKSLCKSMNMSQFRMYEYIRVYSEKYNAKLEVQE